jgi:putative transport protein
MPISTLFDRRPTPVIIGQIGITISGPLKPTFFLMFLFAIGCGVGPQFVRGIAQDGVPQAIFAAV